MNYKVTRTKGQLFEVSIVTGKEQPVADLVVEQFNAADRRKVPAQALIRRISVFRQYQPDTVVLRRLDVFSKHHEKEVITIDPESGKHSLDFGIQRSKSFQNE